MYYINKLFTQAFWFNYKLTTIILCLTLLSIFSTAKAGDKISFRQDVYIAHEPLPKIIAKIKNKIPDFNDEKIREYLMCNLKKITPDLAKEKFNIAWLDNVDLSKIINIDTMLTQYSKTNGTDYKIYQRTTNGTLERYFYPSLVICFISREIGYGLFTIDDIEEGAYIANYTGKISYGPISEFFKEKNEAPEDNDYSYGTVLTHPKNKLPYYYKVNARYMGNASRFGIGFFSTRDDLIYIFGKDRAPRIKRLLTDESYNLVTSNSAFKENQFGPSIFCFLLATRKIARFEQIGVDYGKEYWRSWPDYHPGKEINFFDKDGNSFPISSLFKKNKKKTTIFDNNKDGDTGPLSFNIQDNEL